MQTHQNTVIAGSTRPQSDALSDTPYASDIAPIYVRAPRTADAVPGASAPSGLPIAQRVYCGAAVRILTLSRPLAARLTMDEPYLVISIDSPGKPAPEIAESPLRVGMLRVIFNDIRRAKAGRVLFTREQAREILDFVAAHLPQAKAIIVHCTGGLFRSPAIAAALSAILQGEQRFFDTFHARNPHVYATLLAEWRADPRPAPLCAADAPHRPQAGDQAVTADDGAITLFQGPHGFLSNYSAAKVTLDGVTYPTVEHAFQAAKSLAPEQRERIRLKKNPAWARQTGKSKSFPVRDGWSGMKIGVMLGLLRQKFSEPKRASQLLATGGRELIEGNWWGDTFWGMCQDAEGRWVGENRLGRLLMQVRGELAAQGDLHPQ